MCRWMAWHGQPLLMEELLFKTQHGLIEQSLHSRLGVETTNGDGVGPKRARSVTCTRRTPACGACMTGTASCLRAVRRPPRRLGRDPGGDELHPFEPHVPRTNHVPVSAV
jgi:hypothetical protein